MFYYVSKIAWFFATPSNLLISLVLLGLLVALTRFRKTGLWIAFLAVAVTMVAGWMPLSSMMMSPLEERFPAFQDDGKPVDGIILLGGSVEARESSLRGQMVANESAERVLDTIQLAARYPNARVLISGGGGTVFGDGTAEAPIIAKFFESVKIPGSRILVEDRSRTTYENAVFSRQIAQPKPGERWLLVTSAWHMPRAVGVFRKAGFDVTAYPVDYRTTSANDNLKPFAFISDGLRRLDVVSKEWAGLIGYHLGGRMSELFPAP